MTGIRHYLAFDFGAGSGRAMVGSAGRDKVTLTEVHRFVYEPVIRDGHWRWPFDAMTLEMLRGLELALAAFGDIRSVAVDTWGVDFGLLDEGGRLLEMPVTYRDPRTEGMMDAVRARIDDQTLFCMTGNQPMAYNTLFQFMSVKMQHPDLYEKAASLLFMPDLLNHFLTGTACTEYSIASTSQLLNPGTRQWNTMLFEQLGLRPSLMKRLIFPGDIIGRIKPELCGGRTIHLAAVGAHDTASAVAAVPAQGEWAFLSSGTWSLLGCELEEPQLHPEALADGFTNEGGVNGTVRFLKNIAGMWLLECCRSIWKAQGGLTDYAVLLGRAKAAQPFKALIDVDDARFFNPENMVEAIAAFCRETGQPVPASEGEYTRCILESLALKYRQVLEKLNRYRPHPVETLHIVGGGSQNALLNQFTADATGLTVVAGPVETSALGNILMQMLADGQVETLQQGRDLVRASFDVQTFYPQNHAAWERAVEDCRGRFA